MTHIKLQVCCLIVLLYICFVYISECRKYRRKPSASYLGRLILIGIIEVILDCVATVSVNPPDKVPELFIQIIFAAFFLSINAAVFTIFLYLVDVTGLSPESKRGKILINIPFLLNIAVMTSTTGTLNVVHGSHNNYADGIPAYCCGIFTAVYIILSVIVFIRRWNYMNKDKHGALITFMSLYTAVSIVQVLFPEILLSSFAVSGMIIGVYINFEDPAIKELERYYAETVMCFSTLIENRDSSTGGHIRRTAAYVKLIADELRKNNHYTSILTKDYVENLLNSAPMHDIGKIAIPDSILKKPGKLTDEEFDIMKKHSENGGRIILETFGHLGSKEYSRIAFEVAAYHHEKWDGKGYPEGRQRDQIPLCARIMAVADVFDALSEKTVYRDALPLDKCFEIIKEGSGKDFDPIVADTFINAREKVEKIYNELLQRENMSNMSINVPHISNREYIEDMSG